MAERRRYRRRQGAAVTAVRLDLDTGGFTYRKWGGEQRCKAGDWLVDNAGDVYTVDAEVFAATYREVAPGRFAKHGAVWAERAQAPGKIETKEGATAYRRGDYLVSNDEAGEDGWAMSADRFAALYEPDEADARR
jgi:hypothetical protein